MAGSTASRGPPRVPWDGPTSPPSRTPSSSSASTWLMSAAMSRWTDALARTAAAFSSQPSSRSAEYDYSVCFMDPLRPAQIIHSREPQHGEGAGRTRVVGTARDVTVSRSGSVAVVGPTRPRDEPVPQMIEWRWWHSGTDELAPRTFLTTRSRTEPSVTWERPKRCRRGGRDESCFCRRGATCLGAPGRVHVRRRAGGEPDGQGLDACRPRLCGNCKPEHGG